jgi:dTDP-4-dehydrorhamnose reductase
MSTMKILLTGGTGQVGYALQRQLQGLGQVLAPTRAQLNVGDADAIRAYFRTQLQSDAPNLIINPAAYTAVDKAEQDHATAHAVNAVAPGVLAEEAAKLGALLIHYSTDYVFDGRKEGAYFEDDAPNPLSVYGRTKWAGEQAIRATGASHLILRTTWVYGARGGNFLRTMLKLMQERSALNIVNDQFGAPTWCHDIAAATVQLAQQWYIAGKPAWRDTVNLSASGRTTWFDYAQAILAEAQKSNPAFGLHGQAPVLTGIPSSQYPTPAVRPKNSMLSHQKLNAQYGITMPEWKTALQTCMREKGETQEQDA